MKQYTHAWLAMMAIKRIEKAAQKFDDFSKKILIDSIDSISKVWLRAWKRYTDWNRPKPS